MVQRLFLLIFLLFSGKMEGQGFLWVKSAGGTGIDQANAVATDKVGNVYITGYFKADASFSGILLSENAYSGYGDAFLAKYSSSGTLIWAKGLGGSKTDAGNAITTDDSGNVYVAGSFTDSILFEGEKLTGKGASDVFLGKWDSSGHVIWMRSFGGASYDEAFGIAVNAKGEVFVAGDFRSTSMQIGTTILSSNLNFEIFIASYSASGTIRWAQQAGGVNQDFCYALVSDKKGRFYIGGSFGSTAKFGATSYTTAGGGYDAYLAQFNDDGNMNWLQQGKCFAGDVAYHAAIALDGQGSIYVTGYYSGQIKFSKHASGGGYFAKYDEAGNLKWSELVGGTYPRGIAVKNANNIYVTGGFTDTAAFGTHHLFSHKFTTMDIYLAAMDADGNWLSALGTGGNSDDQPFGMAADINGNVYLAGCYNDAANFGNLSVTAKDGSQDVFLAKYGSGSAGIEEKVPASGFGVFPDPFRDHITVFYGGSFSQLIECFLYDTQGKLIIRRELNSSEVRISSETLPPGLYLLRIMKGNEFLTFRMIK